VALARYLSANAWECAHVHDLGLAQADDRIIWRYARANGLTIITKDEDFQALAIRQGSIPPQVVWVRKWQLSKGGAVGGVWQVAAGFARRSGRWGARGRDSMTSSSALSWRLRTHAKRGRDVARLRQTPPKHGPPPSIPERTSRQSRHSGPTLSGIRSSAAWKPLCAATRAHPRSPPCANTPEPATSSCVKPAWRRALSRADRVAYSSSSAWLARPCQSRPGP